MVLYLLIHSGLFCYPLNLDLSRDVLIHHIVQHQLDIVQPFHHQTRRVLITTPILPTRPPPLLPKSAIKLLLAQLPIDLIMRLAHPIPKIVPPPQSRPISLLRHPRLEVLCARPARVQPREEAEETAHLALLFLGCGLRVHGCEGVEQGPG